MATDYWSLPEEELVPRLGVLWGMEGCYSCVEAHGSAVILGSQYAVYDCREEACSIRMFVLHILG